MSPKRAVLLMRVVVYGFVALFAALALAVRGGMLDGNSSASEPRSTMPEMRGGDYPAPPPGMTSEYLPVSVESRNGRIDFIKIEWIRTCERAGTDTWWVAVKDGDGTRFRREGRRILVNARLGGPRDLGRRLAVRATIDVTLGIDGFVHGRASHTQVWRRNGRVIDRCRTETVDWSARATEVG